MPGDQKIIKNAEMLDDAYVVGNVCARDFQIQELISCLHPALKGEKPVHAWLYARPGTGKTLVAKFVLRDLSREGRLGGIYVNCWENNSYYAVLDKLVRELRILGAEKLNTAF
jgi:cell division control protein 6